MTLCCDASGNQDLPHNAGRAIDGRKKHIHGAASGRCRAAHNTSSRDIVNPVTSRSIFEIAVR